VLLIYAEKFGTKMLWMFTCLLLLHNIVGGFSFIKSKQTDYTSYQSAWLVENATQKDLVLSLGSASMLRYILYYSPVQLCTPEQQFAVCMDKIAATLAAGGRVYLLDDVVHPSKTIAYRHKEAYDAVVGFVNRNKSAIVPANTAGKNVSVVYQLLSLQQ
jgi:hypothetical protein